MHQLTEEIMASKEWRIRELEALKKIGIIALNEYPLKNNNNITGCVYHTYMLIGKGLWLKASNYSLHI